MLINELKLAKELIRRPSVTPIDAGAINILTKNLRSLGFKCQMMNFKNIKNLYAKFGKSSPNFCFAGHTDVVPVGDLKSWSVNPFSGTVKNNKLIGRGASDMKGSIACFIAALSQFKKIKPKFKGSISLLITGDEEAIAINGTKKVVEKGSVLSMGVYIGASTRIIDRATGEIIYGKVPAYSVVVPGSMPSKNNPDGPSLYCVVIVKKVDEKTRSKTSINDLLRD